MTGCYLNSLWSKFAKNYPSRIPTVDHAFWWMHELIFQISVFTVFIGDYPGTAITCHTSLRGTRYPVFKREQLPFIRFRFYMKKNMNMTFLLVDSGNFINHDRSQMVMWDLDLAFDIFIKVDWSRNIEGVTICELRFVKHDMNTLIEHGNSGLESGIIIPLILSIHSTHLSTTSAKHAGPFYILDTSINLEKSRRQEIPPVSCRADPSHVTCVLSSKGR